MAYDTKSDEGEASAPSAVDAIREALSLAAELVNRIEQMRERLTGSFGSVQVTGSCGTAPEPSGLLPQLEDRSHSVSARIRAAHDHLNAIDRATA